MRILLVFICFCFHIAIVEAATFYVSPDGSDTGLGTQNSPWRTLGKGFSAMSGGDTLVLGDGTYVGDNNVFNFHVAGQYPPSGSIVSGYTTVMAQNSGMVIIDGQMQRIPFDGHDSDYLIVKGIVFSNSSDTVFSLAGNSANFCTNIKIQQCGFSEANSRDGNPRCDVLQLRFCDYSLVEDCYAWGNGKYRFYCLDSQRVIFRRCVDRLDRCVGDEDYSNVASFRIYGSSSCLIQNCIAVDCDQSDMVLDDGGGLSYPYAIFLGWNPSTGRSCDNNSIRGSIAVNGTARMGVLLVGNDDNTKNNLIEDCAFLNMYRGVFYRQNNPLTWFHNISCISSQGPHVQSDYLMINASNSIFAGANTTALNNVTSNFNVLYNNGDNYESCSAGLNDYCAENGNAVNPLYSALNTVGGIKYIVRVESDSNLSSKGSDGLQIGPHIMNRIGSDGTLYGETGYNTDTGIPLWPFPHEAMIRSRMRTYAGGGIDGARGFCADGQSLTKYIWGYLGNPVPADLTQALSGKVQNARGQGVSGVSMVISEGISDTAATDSSGAYTFVGLALGSDYTITPVKEGYTFSPPNRTISNFAETVAGLNFTASGLAVEDVVQPQELRVVGSAAQQGTVNPTKGDTAKIYFQGTTTGTYECRIFNINRVLVWQDEKEGTNMGMFEWFPKDMPSGAYIVNVQGPGFSQTKKFAVLK